MKRQSGFTLIELMIVVAIIGVLTGIGYPSYRQHVLKSARSDAHVGLVRMADLQEKFYLQNNRYGTAAEVAATTEHGYYNLTVSAASVSGFTLTATPVGGQLDDAACDGTAGKLITLNQAGQKTPAACWN